jgi:hypothetical protein
MFDLLIIFLIIIIIIIIILFISHKKFYNLKNYNPSCHLRRWGCCNDNLTAKLNIFGSNCRGF